MSWLVGVLSFSLFSPPLALAGSRGFIDTSSHGGTDASASRATWSPGFAACADLGSNHRAFPSCLTLSSPTAMIPVEGVPKLKPGSDRGRLSSMRVASRRGLSGNRFPAAYALQAAQLASLLNGSNARGQPARRGAYARQTLRKLGRGVLSAVAAKFSVGTEGCFGPGLYYSHHPEGGTSNPPLAATGQLPPGDLGIWLSESTDPAYAGQACSAAELNALLAGPSTYAQFALAITAEMRFLTGWNLPSRPGTSDDVTVSLAHLASSLGAAVQSATVSRSNDGTAYIYSAQFTLPQSGTPLAASVTLTHADSGLHAFSGVLQYSYDDGTWVTAGTTRYQRTSQTNLNLSARNTFYPHGTAPVVDSNGELDPSDTNWTMRFSRFGASFDPTSPLLTGNYVFTRQINAPGQYGPGVSDYMTNVFQVALPGDGTGSAFYGIGHAIDQPDVGTIQYVYCERSSGQQMLRAQYQPFEFDSGAGEYVPSSTIPAQIRYAPTSSCTYTVSQWNDGNAGGFWYDRALEHANDATQPTPPTPIPEYVVADPNSTDYPFNLFGDGSTLQPQINALGFTMPAVY
jgi:hypothetical protein